MEKKAWWSWESLLHTPTGVEAGPEFEELAPSSVAVADLGTTLRRKTGGICKPRGGSRWAIGGGDLSPET